MLDYNNITYVGERLWAGQLGHTLVILSFVFSLLASAAYFFSVKTQSESLKKVGRWGFIAHSITALGMVSLLFYMIVNQFFEYQYVWKYSNVEMPLKYILSCFWGGQEGSILLWIFWHVFLGLILLKTSKKWEAPVMSIFAFVQALLTSTILGIYVFDFQLGNSPFVLAREYASNFGLPWTYNSNYLAEIPTYQTGYGLNPLLQNYWMTIHPPILFLGFALTLIPFSYALGGLMTKSYNEWIKPVISWTFFGIGVLGIGILLGGAWAYESLSFGGFWAWDPVENASFIPWLILVGAGHVMLVNKKKNISLFSTFLLSMLAFILVFYSTFLTRSGILGDSSVHSFTGEGMLGLLLSFLLLFIYLMVLNLLIDKKLKLYFTGLTIALALVQLFTDFSFTVSDFELTTTAIVTCIAFLGVLIFLIRSYNKHFPKPEAEEHLWSREFWMFIGSLVLVLAAVQILLPTSIPVWNKVFGTQIDPITESIERNAFYNKWQVPFAFFVTVIIAIAQYFSYKKSEIKKVLKHLSASFFISVAIAFTLSVLIFKEKWSFSNDLLLFASIFSILANTNYYIKFLKGKLSHGGSSIAHIGFGLVILGALISNGQKEVISENDADKFRLEFLSEDFKNTKDVQLIKGDTTFMSQYFLNYTKKESIGHNVYYHIDYFHPEAKQYKKGDRVKYNHQPIEALEDHSASENFISDSSKWIPIEITERLDYFKLEKWSPYQAGEKAFTLKPFLQKNEDFGNVPEPGTKHYPTFDVFTHVRWADFSDGDDNYMPSSTYKANFKKDTVFTPNFKIILDTIEIIHPNNYGQYGLGESDFACKVKMNFYSIYDRAETKFVLEPLFIKRDFTLHIPDIYTHELLGVQTSIGDNNLLMRFMAQNLPNSEVSEEERLKLEDINMSFSLANKEYIVLQAIVFPYINLLWIGALLMLIGTLMAVYHRVKTNNRHEK